MTIENIPHTDYNPNANFCFRDASALTLPHHPMIIQCEKHYNGRYLLIQKKTFPDTITSIHIFDIYVYGKKTLQKTITGI